MDPSNFETPEERAVYVLQESMLYCAQYGLDFEAMLEAAERLHEEDMLEAA